jgi:hypothetical protein
MRLVKNARQSWRWWSVQLAGALAFLPIVWEQMPYDIKAMIPAEWHTWIVSGMALAIIVARNIDQGGSNGDT